MIKITHQGNFKNTERLFNRALKRNWLNILKKYGDEGMKALSSATPVDSSETARSWDYIITSSKNEINISWTNSHIVDGVPIAIILQYGHGTRNGGYVQGRDYINPAIRPVFDKISNDIWKEVTE